MVVSEQLCKIRPRYCTTASAILVVAFFTLFAETVSGNEAKDRYEEAIELYKAREYAKAANAFREANRLQPSWKLYYNIGQAEAAARRYGLALDAFEAYLVGGGDEVERTRREEILKEIEGFKLLVGTIEIDAPDGTTVFIDDELRGAIPLEGTLRVAAGVHRFVLKKDDVVLSEKSLRVSGGTKTMLKAEGTSEDQEGQEDPPATNDDGSPRAPDEQTPPPSSESGISGKMIAGITLGGLGLVGIGIGTAFAVKASGQKSGLDDINDEAVFNTEKAAFKTSRAIGVAGLATGGAFLTAGIVLIALDIRARKKAEATPRVSFAPTPNGLAVTF